MAENGKATALVFAITVALLWSTSYPGSRATTVTVPDSVVGAQAQTVFTYYTSPETWHKARAACETLTNGHLVVILDSATLTTIQSYASGPWGSDWDHVWTGLHWGSDDVLKWADNSCSASTIGAAFFESASEMSQDSQKKCYMLDQGNFELISKTCDETKYFICQHYEVVPSPAYTPHQFSMIPATPSSDCQTLCTTTVGCFLYYHYQSDQCVLAIADQSAMSYSKQTMGRMALDESSVPSLPGGLPTGYIPDTCTATEITFPGYSSSSELSTPATGVTCPTTTTEGYVSTGDPTTRPPTTATTPAATTTITTPPTTTTESATTTNNPTTTTTTSPSSSSSSLTTTTTTTSSSSSSSSTSSPSSSSSSSSSSPSSTSSSSSSSSPATTTDSAIISNHTTTNSSPHTNNQTAIREIEAIIKDLKIDSRSTSKFKARLKSAEDSRKSSEYMGLGGIIALSGMLVSILIMDIPVFIRNIRSLYDYKGLEQEGIESDEQQDLEQKSSRPAARSSKTKQVQ